MSFLSCSPKHVLEATLSACKDPSPNPQELFSNGLHSRLPRRTKSPTIVDLKNSRKSRLSLKKVQSSKSIKQISLQSSTQSLYKNVTKQNVLKADDYGFFEWRPHPTYPRNMRRNDKKVSITYISPEPKKIIENRIHSPLPVRVLLSKQSMTTQPSIMEIKQSMSSILAPARQTPIFEAQQIYFTKGPSTPVKKIRELEQKVSFMTSESPTHKPTPKTKKKQTLNIFNPKEIDSQIDDENQERDEEFSVVVERHQPINPFEELGQSTFRKRI